MSQPVTFASGIQYVLLGESYQVIQILDDGMLVAKNLATHAHIAHRLADLWRHWNAQTLEFIREGAKLPTSAEMHLPTTSSFVDLAILLPRLQNITWHRYQLIRPLLALPSRARTKQVVEQRIQCYRSLLDPSFASLPPTQGEQTDTPDGREDETKPCPSSLISRQGDTHPTDLDSPQQLACFFDIPPRTVARWIRRYQISHQDIRSLVPSYHTRGPRHAQLDPLLQSLLQQAIHDTYLTNVRAPVTHVINAFHHLIATENATRAPQDHLKAPGKMTVYRTVAQLDPIEVDAARLGRAQAGRIHHQTQIGPLCTRPNQRAELDFARLDLMVVDDTDRLPIGRPTIAAIRDKYTGYLLGIYISFDPPSYRVAMECMLYAFLPKEHVKAQFHTQHEYLAFGIPEVLVVDNAIELHRDLELACLQLGIELQHMPVRIPWFKGSIERWFRTLNEDLIHSTPGTTFSHFLERGDYDSQKHACITLDRLWELLHVWIVDVYTQEVHSGLGGRPRGKGIPAQLWQQALEEQFVPCLPPSRNDLLVLVSRTTTRTLHHYGIEFEHLLYQDDTLLPLRNKFKSARAYPTARGEIAAAKRDDIRAGIVHIKYHPGDLSRIWVRDPFSDQYLEVHAADHAYTDNLSLWKHRVITRYTREELKRQINPGALVEAKARIQQLITEQMRLTRKIRSRQGMARWWNEQVTTWISEEAHTISPTSTSNPENTSHLQGQALPQENAPGTSSSLHRGVSPFTQTTAVAPLSVADLRAPLSDVQPEVVLLPDDTPPQQRTPFAPFPPLPVTAQVPRKKPRRQRRASNQRATHNEPAEQLPASHVQPHETHNNTLISHQEKTRTIDERKASFGIEVRSTLWR